MELCVSDTSVSYRYICHRVIECIVFLFPLCAHTQMTYWDLRWLGSKCLGELGVATVLVLSLSLDLVLDWIADLTS